MLLYIKGNMQLRESIETLQDDLNKILGKKTVGTIAIQSLDNCFTTNGVQYTGHSVTIRICKENGVWVLAECKLHGVNKNMNLFLEKDVEALVY